MRHGARALAAVLALGVAGGCSSLTDAGPAELLTADLLQVRAGSGVVFLTMRSVPAVSMEALFLGRVVADAEGCLRRYSPDGPTLVWPKDYRFEVAGTEIRILDDGGNLVGRVGEEFHLGGGEVPSLPDALGFTQADRDLAEEQCPGTYWIVGTD